MKKIGLILMFLSTLFIMGCPFTGSAEHRRAHKKAIERDMTEIHKFVDRHIWNYDWDDPFYN